MVELLALDYNLTKLLTNANQQYSYENQLANKCEMILKLQGLSMEQQYTESLITEIMFYLHHHDTNPRPSASSSLVDYHQAFQIQSYFHFVLLTKKNYREYGIS